MADVHPALAVGVDTEHLRRYREAKKARGECAYCKAPALPARAMCEKHLTRVREKHRVRMEAMRAAGRCVICGDPAPGRRWRCALCQRIYNARQKEVRKQLHAKGMCPHCRKRPRSSRFRHCNVCRRYMADRMQRKRVGQRRKLEFHKLFYGAPGAVADRFYKLMQGRSS